MRDYMKEYIEKIDKIIDEKKINNKEELLSEHLVKIQFFQHERLIHFLVTMLFAIMFLMTFLYSLNNFNIGLIILNILLLCLLVPYIFHYYYLENSVQYMYKQYDMLKNSK
ncbi:MAG: hypothetical protein IKO78_01110 [Bacilli bacterium]|nr:hypothetical protein [Bacilli bacterium]